jgi:hypothetical protein
MNPTRSITISVVLARAPSDGSSGSFSLERRLRNDPGRDTISAGATSPSGEVCRATLTI